MNIFSPLLMFAGLGTGVLLWSRIAAWMIGARNRAHLAGQDSNASNLNSGELLGVLLRIGAVWLALLISASIFAFRLSASAANWLWFFGGALLALCLIIGNAFATQRRVARRRGQNAL